MRITLRLNITEAEQLCAMATSENGSAENKSEFVRMLLAREWNRRKGLPKPKPAQYESAHRIGRPDWQTARANRAARQKTSDA
jgi:hypothetical protein